MHSLFANVLNETEKLWKLRRTRGFLLLTFLIPVISAILLAFLQNNTGVLWGLGSNLPMLMPSLFTFALLPADPSKPQYIETIWGVGYRLNL